MKMDALIQAYTSTRFTVYEPKLTILIGQSNKDLDDLLMTYGVNEWAYITAWNPYSKPTNPDRNDERHKDLLAELTDYPLFAGEGVGTDPEWEPEKSVLVLGISRQQAVSIGNKYEQNAIVFGVLNTKAELVMLV
ncbi:MAG: DUF3293 domain-containing protein [Bacteroidota bacterium]|jgi:hypothetical protein